MLFFSQQKLVDDLLKAFDIHQVPPKKAELRPFAGSAGGIQLKICLGDKFGRLRIRPDKGPLDTQIATGKGGNPVATF
jgi:hypothetical protein